MHTFTAEDGTTFIYNPDLSEVRIVTLNKQIEDVSYMTEGEPVSHVYVSGPALREFIVSNIRDGLISELESFDINKFFS